MDFLNTPEKLNRRLNHLPMGRFGEAIEQAKAVLFREYLVSRRAKSWKARVGVADIQRSRVIVASDDSSYVTGHDMLVDGGLTSAYVVSFAPAPDTTITSLWCTR